MKLSPKQKIAAAAAPTNKKLLVLILQLLKNRPRKSP